MPQNAVIEYTLEDRVPDCVHDLSAQGFVELDSISDLQEVGRIRSILMGLFARRAGANEGKLFDTMAAYGDDKVSRSPQISNPAAFAPELLQTSYVQNATFLAKQLLSPDCVLKMDFVLVKPAHIGRGTPWHQDEAYRDSRFFYNELTFWMPLQDVGVEDGCMAFIPNSHTQGILDHELLDGDATRPSIECVIDPDMDARAVACPLKAGGCTIHHQRTLHSSGDNISSVDRYAYILVFGMPTTPPTGNELFPWLKQRRMALRARKAWMLRGGIFLILLRKIRRGDFRKLSDVRDMMKGGLDGLRGK